MKTRRILSTILAIVLVVSTFTFGSFNAAADTAAPNVVYVSNDGNDSGSGAEDAPLESFSKAVEKVADGGTIYVMGAYNYTGANSGSMYPFPATTKKITVKGYDSSSVFQFPQAGQYQGDPQMMFDITFKNIKLDVQRAGGGGFFTNGSKTTFAGNVSLTGAVLFIGNLAATTESEHIVFADGLTSLPSLKLGNAVSTIVSKNLTFEAYNGSTAPLIDLVQETSWAGNSDKGTVGGDLRVKVDATSKIERIVNELQKTTFNGSYMQIVEDGAVVHTPNAAFLSAFKNNGIAETGYYKVIVKNPEGGSVDFSKQSGYIDITAETGYVAQVKRGDDEPIYYAGAVKGVPTTFGNGVETVVTFERKQAVGEINLLIDVPEPTADGETPSFAESFYVTVEGDQEAVDASIETVSPASIDNKVAHSTRYTYTVKLQAIGDSVFTDDFEFKINNKTRYIKELSEEAFDEETQYRISNLQKSYNEITFDYKLDKATDADPTKFTLEYNGGVGSAIAAGKEVPDVEEHAITNLSDPQEEWTAGYVDVINPSDIFVKKGYECENYYYIDESGNKQTVLPGEASFELTKNTVLYVEWEKIPSITVNFQGNGPAWGFTPAITDKYDGDVITLPFCDYAAPRDRYFAGWKCNVGDTDKLYQPGEQYTVPAMSEIPAGLSTSTGATISFYAEWVLKDQVSSAVYYVSSNGDDENNDGSPGAPFATINAAAEKAKTENVTVVVVDSALLTGLDSKSEKQLTIRGASENSELKILSSMHFSRPTVIEYINLNVSSGATVFTNGYKAEFGPNLPNKSPYFKLNIADGAEGGVIKSVNTTINAGVEIGTYNFGGKYVSGKDCYIESDSYVTFNNGSKFQKIDISPINASGAGKSVYTMGNVTFNINGQFVEFTVSDDIENLLLNPVFNELSNIILLFNNGTIPAKLPATLASDGNVFIVDAGPGSTGKILSDGSISAFYCTSPYMYATSEDTEYTRAAGHSFLLKDYVIGSGQYSTNKVRFGTPIDTAAFDLTFASQPTAGVSTSVVAAPSIDSSECYVQFDSENPWSPVALGGYFGYDRQYTANLVIVPKSGYFFDDFGELPTFNVDGPAKLNPDGTISVSYKFPTFTDYEAPEINVRFFSKEVDTGLTTKETPVHLGEITLPSAPPNKPFIQYFGGWVYNGETYPANSKITITDDVDTIRFDAKWITYCSVNFPTVLLLYDYSSQGADLGRNPKFSPTDSPILTEGTLSNLEYPIGGSTVAPTKNFDREKTTYIESDGSEYPMWVNETNLSSNKIKAGEYKYMTVVYYYKTKAGKAVGQNGKMTFGNCKLPDGSISKWFAETVKSEDKVVSNKWATMTFDLTDAIKKSGVPEDAIFSQFHIWPIGDLPCSKLGGDTLYMKALYFSKEPPITSEE